MTQLDQWNPSQYNKFRDERAQPFVDLVAMVQPAPAMRIIDLGCGAGELTASLLNRFPDATVEGVDASAKMLEQAAAHAGPRLSFRAGDVRDVTDVSPYDLVLSNAVFQWVPDNAGLVGRILSQLRPGAQIAFQLPNNEAHPSHALAAAVASESPFREMLGGFVRRSEALTLEQYATLLYDHGLREHMCIEKIYGHVLANSADVVEWVKGTSLGAYLARLNEPDSAAFLTAYRERLLGTIGDHSPYFYPFRRLLFWGRKGG